MYLFGYIYHNTFLNIISNRYNIRDKEQKKLIYITQLAIGNIYNIYIIYTVCALIFAGCIFRGFCLLAIFAF